MDCNSVPFVALYHPYRNDVESYCSRGHHAVEVRNIINVIVDVITFVMMAVLTNAAVTVLMRIVESGETSPAMLLPMWIMYLIVLVGFILGALRSVEMFVIHIKHINVEPKSTIEEQTEFELESGNFDTEAIRNMGKEGDK